MGVANTGLLPWGEAVFGGGQERPILENSTACTMSNAKNPTVLYVIDLFRVRIVGAADSFGKRYKQQSKSVLICSVSFKLVASTPTVFIDSQ